MNDSFGHKDIDITILVTCYNEEAFVADTLNHVITALKSVGKTYEIIVIDDVSSDGSVNVIRDYMRQHPTEPIFLKVNESNKGLATNYVDAAFLGKGKYYRLCCGDDCESVPVLVSLFSLIGKADMIVPYQNQNQVTGKSESRRMISNLFTTLVNIISGNNLR